MGATQTAEVELRALTSCRASNRVDAGGLHGHGGYATLLEPSRHALQVRSPGSELLHRLRIPARRYRHKMTRIANVNSRRVRVNNLQIRFCGVEPAFQFFPLLAIEAAAVQPLKGGLLAFSF